MASNHIFAPIVPASMPSSLYKQLRNVGLLYDMEKKIRVSSGFKSYPMKWRNISHSTMGASLNIIQQSQAECEGTWFSFN